MCFPSDDDLRAFAAAVRAWRSVSQAVYLREVGVPEFADAEGVRRALGLARDTPDPRWLREARQLLRTEGRLAVAGEGVLIDGLRASDAAGNLNASQWSQAQEYAQQKRDTLSECATIEAMRNAFDRPGDWWTAYDDFLARSTTVPVWLAGYLRATAARTDGVVPHEAAVAAAGAAYGPDDWPANRTDLAQLIADNGVTAATPLPTVLERVLVWWAKRRRRGPLAPAARYALTELVRQQIVFPLRWVEENIFFTETQHVAAHAAARAKLIAPLLAGAVAAGCDCWRQWETFGVESPVRGLYACSLRHTLARWNGSETLAWFLRTAIVNGNVGGDQANVNDFRRGMLAKVQELALVAGQVLRCTAVIGTANDEVVRCGRIILENDRCSHRDTPHAAYVTKTSDWMWRRGDFGAHAVRRCAGHLPNREPCRCLTFQTTGACRHCDQNEWLRQPVNVWVPVRTVPYYDGIGTTGGRGSYRTPKTDDDESGPDESDLNDPPPFHDPLGELRRRCAEWPADQVGDVAEALLDDDATWTAIALRHDLDPSSAEYLALVLEGVLRWATRPRLQRMSEVYRTYGKLTPEDQRIAERLFWMSPEEARRLRDARGRQAPGPPEPPTELTAEMYRVIRRLAELLASFVPPPDGSGQ